MDKICINRLEIFARHGVMREENTLGQKFIISAELTTDTEAAGEGDNLDQTVNYARVCESICEFNETHTFKLIEAAAEHMAYSILDEFVGVTGVKIRIEKPNPPIHMHFDSVSVEIERKRHTAYISVGSNMGDRQRYIENAVSALSNHGLCRVGRVSRLIETEPYGGVSQDKFLNGIIELQTTLSPLGLLKILNKIEAKNGRERSIHWGPRTLDLDIIFYDDIVMKTERLTIPHADMHNRLFVLEPLNELAPQTIHPVLGRSVCSIYTELLQKCDK
ncbi:MAG: 2-amino-4-hydroxy-6-hydroxymethyldihydropteridine diphosphokinase [Clostridiales bacterium]|nr:2-amino-4-hydroxy-6-hydroxymethyldihydropteridine diphosphokinase [Clostridiales bacterium]